MGMMMAEKFQANDVLHITMPTEPDDQLRISFWQKKYTVEQMMERATWFKYNFLPDDYVIAGITRDLDDGKD
jgi:hypothetical protein